MALKMMEYPNPKGALKLRGEEDPLRLSETFVRKLQAFSAAAHP